MSSKPQYQSPYPPPPQQQPPPPSYSQAPPPYGPPPPDEGISRTLLIVIVVVVVLVIVIPIILSAVLYFIASDLLTNGGGQLEPNVNIDDGEPMGFPLEWRLEVASVSSAESLGYFRVSVLNGTSIAIAATDLQSVKNAGDTGVSGDGLTLEFIDATDDGKLNGGDWFIVSGTDHSSDYQVVLYWKASGNKVSGSTGMIQQ